MHLLGARIQFTIFSVLATAVCELNAIRCISKPMAVETNSGSRGGRLCLSDHSHGELDESLPEELCGGMIRR